MPKPASSKRAALITLVGVAAAITAADLTSRWEGTEHVGYRDIVGVATYCTGVTGPEAVVGKRYTVAECDEADSRAIIAHAKPVLACTPGLRDRPHALGAAISLTYNIGPTAYCRSTVARRFNAGDIRGGCDAFLMWDKAGGRTVRGLQNRRRDERAQCLKSL